MVGNKGNIMSMIKKISLIVPVIISLLFTPHYSHTMDQPIESFQFMELPQDVRTVITNLLTSNSAAKTLTEAAQTIKALAETNKYFNTLLNNPEFCLQI